MQGMYINCQWSPMPGGAAPSRPPAVFQTTVGDDQITVCYHETTWPKPPIYRSDKSPNVTAVVAGWFLFDEELNNLSALIDAIVNELRSSSPQPQRWVARLQGGNFLIYLYCNGQRYLITDPFGLFAHYIDTRTPWEPLRVAPLLAPLVQERQPDPFFADILVRHGHLFADDTSYCDIKRCRPGSILTSRGGVTYYAYDATATTLPHEVVGLVAEHLAALARYKWLLPLSGGFDSRLLLAAARLARTDRVDHGYTFGPADSGDRPITRQFESFFAVFDSFSIEALSFDESYRQIAQLLFDGLSAHPLPFLFAVNQRAERQLPGCLALDGYAGDVLQRGIYLQTKKASDIFSRTFPQFFRRRINAEALIKQRYPSLTDSQFRYLMEKFEQCTAHLQLDAAHRVALFELIDGRGARYILQGGTTTARQYFDVVQPFLFCSVFHTLFQEPHLEWLTLRSLYKVWSAVDRELSDITATSGISFKRNPQCARLEATWTSVARKLELTKRLRNYESELRNTLWVSN